MKIHMRWWRNKLIGTSFRCCLIRTGSTSPRSPSHFRAGHRPRYRIYPFFLSLSALSFDWRKRGERSKWHQHQPSPTIRNDPPPFHTLQPPQTAHLHLHLIPRCGHADVAVCRVSSYHIHYYHGAGVGFYAEVGFADR